MSEMAYKYKVSLRFKDGNKSYTFCTNDETIENNDLLVVETSQGLELGKAVSNLSLIEENENLELKPVLRKANDKDVEEYNYNIKLASEAMSFTQEKINELGLDMQLIKAQYTLDRSKILIIYLADERVDFRELLKLLAAHLKCRIELKQIGARDRAKLVGGVGVCGRECCCSRFLDKFDVISINMAKNQLLALNIPKLSGQCGKLMCCLSYEDDGYIALIKGLPKLNSNVEYNSQLYTVTSLNPLKDEIKLENRNSVIIVNKEELINKAIIFKPMGIKKKVKDEEE